MDDNETGGLSDSLLAEVRAAAFDAIQAWRAGRPVALAQPSAELRLKMMSWVMAEKIPAEYDSIIAAELFAGLEETTEKLWIRRDLRFLLLAREFPDYAPRLISSTPAYPSPSWKRARRLVGSGVTIAILARRRYPNHLYSFTRAPYDWSMYFALRDELHAYLDHVAEKFGLRSHIRFETEVKSADYDRCPSGGRSQFVTQMVRTRLSKRTS